MAPKTDPQNEDKVEEEVEPEMTENDLFDR